jgi:hypothetical protein
MSYKKNINILENEFEYDRLLYDLVDKLKTITDDENIIYKIHFVTKNKYRHSFSTSYDSFGESNKQLVFSFLKNRFKNLGNERVNGLGSISDFKYKNIIKDIPILFDNFNIQFMKNNGYFVYFKKNNFMDLCTDIYYDYVDEGNTTYCHTIGRLEVFMNTTPEILFFHIEYQESSVDEDIKIYLSRDLFHLLKYAVVSKHTLALASLYSFEKKFKSISSFVKWMVVNKNLSYKSFF